MVTMENAYTAVVTATHPSEPTRPPVVKEGVKKVPSDILENFCHSGQKPTESARQATPATQPDPLSISRNFR